MVWGIFPRHILCPLALIKRHSLSIVNDHIYCVMTTVYPSFDVGLPRLVD